MTLKGHKNHYNMKLLRGYGASISLRSNKVSLKGGRDVFAGQQEVEE
jgi:CRISP-associated protein Cas1